MLLENLTVDEGVEGQNEDFIPGKGGFTLNTGIYPMVVELAYHEVRQSGAEFINVTLKEVGGNRTLKENFCVRSGTAKGGKTTYIDKRSGKPRPLPGMEAINQLCLVLTGKPLSAQTGEKKVANIYNFDERKEVATQVDAVTSIMGQTVQVAVVKCSDNKRQNIGGEWVDTNERRDFNEIQKFMNAEGTTVSELQAGQDAGKFRDGWAKNFDATYVRDKFSPVEGVGDAIADASNAAAEAGSPAVSTLFDTDD